MADKRGVKSTYRQLRSERSTRLLELANRNGNGHVESCLASKEAQGTGVTQDLVKCNGSDATTEGLLLLGRQSPDRTSAYDRPSRRDPGIDNEEHDRFWASEALYPA